MNQSFTTEDGGHYDTRMGDPNQKEFVYVVTGGMEYDGQTLLGCYNSVQAATDFINEYIENCSITDDFFHIYEMVVGENNLDTRYNPVKVFKKKVSFVEE